MTNRNRFHITDTETHRNSSVVVRPLTEAQARAKAGAARQAAKTRATNKRLRG